MALKNFVWALDSNGNPCKCYAAPENRGKGKCKHFCHADENKSTKEAMQQLSERQKARVIYEEEIKIKDNDRWHVRNEKNVLAAFPVGEQVKIGDKLWLVEKAGRPHEFESGNCKTDVYVQLSDGKQIIEKKFSIKKPPHPWIENHMVNRIKSIFSVEPENFSKEVLSTHISDEWMEKNNDIKLTNQGQPDEELKIPYSYNYALAPEFKKGNKFFELPLSKEAAEDVYAGTQLSSKKRHCKIGEKVVKNSGVANEYLIMDCSTYVPDANDIVSTSIPLDDNFYKEHSNAMLEVVTSNLRIRYKNGKFYSHKPDGGNQVARREMKLVGDKLSVSNEIMATNIVSPTYDSDSGLPSWKKVNGHSKDAKILDDKTGWKEISSDSMLGQVIKVNKPKSLTELFECITKH